MGIKFGGEIRRFKVQSATDGRIWDAIETAHFQNSHSEQIIYRFETTDGQVLKEIPGSMGEYTIPVLQNLIVVEIISNES